MVQHGPGIHLCPSLLQRTSRGFPPMTQHNAGHRDKQAAWHDNAVANSVFSQQKQGIAATQGNVLGSAGITQRSVGRDIYMQIFGSSYWVAGSSTADYQ